MSKKQKFQIINNNGKRYNKFLKMRQLDFKMKVIDNPSRLCNTFDQRLVSCGIIPDA